MHPAERRHIDNLARAANRAEGRDEGGCLVALIVGAACWVVIFALVARIIRWVHA